MADASHLERMGRELKCPICLSLFNSAVSLTCNHVFCNSCIEKSMKAASSCPVCKVPYRRREIRPAPHMDNLVSVYKSMEVASGVSIFVTQTEASTGPSGNKNDKTGVNVNEVQNNVQTKLEVSEFGNRKQHQRKGSKSASVFPTKKRVQVSPHTSTRTDMKQGKLKDGIAEINRNETKSSPVLQNDVPSICENGGPKLPPFFWLREQEDMEKSTQQTDDNSVMYTPPEAPCFSDIKDSDDERGTCKLSNNADFIDSEMFDWTQRPCSPELCSSPPTIQLEEHTAEEDVALKSVEATPTETAGPQNRPKSTVGKRKRTETSESKGRMRTSNKKANSNEPEKDKKAKRISKVSAVDAGLGNVIYQDMQEGNKDTRLIQKGKSRKGKMVLSDACVQEKNVISLSDGGEPLENGKGVAFTHVSPSENSGNSNKGRTKSKKSGEDNKNSKKPTQLPKSGSKEKTKKCLDTDQDKEGLISERHTNLHPPGTNEEISDRCIKRKDGRTCRKAQPSSLKKVKFSVESICNDNHDGKALGANEKDATRDQSFQEIQVESDRSDMKTPSKVDKSTSSLSGHTLLKCNTSPRTIHCAFCQSSEESEASGIMVHYVSGKLVIDDARKNAAIHVHKNCAEWAPNVYFEDDTAVNLENELSRSRRIRCCCCGIKGAALGCYEKSCRKSFHVPCARLTPECRWDSENFVILCPIHKSSQLPIDMPQSQSRKKSKSSAERKSCLRQDKVKTKEECKDSSPSHWKSQKKFRDLVFCCSALTNAEKEIVTEFENLSGVPILKNWDSTVTHVIASTDENGACRRTLKFLMGVLEGKWILSVKWIKACIEAGEIVDEEQFEISVDIHGISDGPKLGRLRLLNKQPKLFDGYTFYFMGDFVPSYRGYLHDLVIAAGGKVLNRKPVAGDQTAASNGSSETSFIIYSVELPEQCKPSSGSSVMDQRRTRAEALASSTGALIASNSWIMNSIAGYKLQAVSK
ncbi:protein BREAST CANCER SUSCEPTIBILITY 1 homolog [Salvia miltiorrhiza]|uniref:protein BREAST CANCER SUSCEPTIBILITY 1 homolog n=1 Tax=Salvia miltiorrhiza TaxID=226208 RepID=UPI0025AB9B2F|nr:protein BREAST CANCER SUSCEPTIBILITY 1 homolog [Salvia miltiorrhiza]